MPPGASTPPLPSVFLPGVLIQPDVRARAQPYVAAPAPPSGLALLGVSSRPLPLRVQPLASFAVTLLRAFCFRPRSLPSLVEQVPPLFAASLSARVPPVPPSSWQVRAPFFCALLPPAAFSPSLRGQCVRHAPSCPAPLIPSSVVAPLPSS